MSQCFGISLYHLIDEFERVIREFEKVTACGANMEGFDAMNRRQRTMADN